MSTQSQPNEQSLTDSQLEFIKTSKELETLKEKLKDLNSKAEELLVDIGVGSLFQDPEDGTVFEVVVPTGTYVSFKSVDYNRTRRIEEKRSPKPLALKKAEEAGFTVPKKS